MPHKINWIATDTDMIIDPTIDSQTRRVRMTKMKRKKITTRNFEKTVKKKRDLSFFL